MRPLQLNARGAAHYFLLAFVVVGVAIGGTFYLVRSFADTNNTTSSSTTWAGYQAVLPSTSTDHFNAVKATFKVPKITCDAADKQEAYESFSQWVGIDGVNNENLVQTGIESHCVAGKNHAYQAVYFPWWEVIQGAGNDVWRGKQFAVKPGDTMEASVNFANKQYTIALQNKTTGKSFTVKKTCYNGKSPCPRASAEWVIERPGGANMNGYGGVLANFGLARFSQATAQSSAKRGILSINQVRANSVNMTNDNNGGLLLASTSLLGKDQKSFSIVFNNHGTTSASSPH